MDRDQIRKMSRMMKLVDRLGMMIITAAISYGAQQVKDLSKNVAELNTSVAVILERDKSRADAIHTIEERLGIMEKSIAKIRRRDDYDYGE